MLNKSRVVSVIGLGYVGLPVAVAFGLKAKTIGFDINDQRIKELKDGFDRNRELSSDDLAKSDILFTDEISDLKRADFYVVAVPTPIDDVNQPDLKLLKKASEMVSKVVGLGDIVVYESTVYPGATEEICVPLLEEGSGLKCGVDFRIGYSPERINPGDKKHTLSKIIKIVSAQDEEALNIIAKTYETIITAGVYRAPSIRVAEAAKVIENIQRDLNIALVNELALLFDRMRIDTNEVLAAAGTKWNFLDFKPGLVGGHCIGVDPYYLTHKAEKVGYIPEVILAGRRINNSMSRFIAQKTIKEMIKAGHDISKSTVTVLGLAFKENCPDLRNSKVIGIVRELEEHGIHVQVHDTLADSKDAEREYGITLREWKNLKPAEAVIVAVPHEAYCKLLLKDIKKMMGKNPVLIDVKGIYEVQEFQAAGIRMWRL